MLHHTELSASICTAVAAAVDEQDEANAVDEEEIWCVAAAATIDSGEHAIVDEFSEEGVEDLNKAFDDLVGAKTTGQDDLDYSSNDNDDDYFQEMKDKACIIEYSNTKKVGKTLHIPSFSKTCSPWTVCTFCVIPEQGKCVQIFLFVPMRSTK
jgi:hypothetical protein